MTPGDGVIVTVGNTTRGTTFSILFTSGIILCNVCPD